MLTVHISKLIGTKTGNKRCHFNSSGAVPPWQTDAEVDVGTIFMFETATIPATGTLSFFVTEVFIKIIIFTIKGNAISLFYNLQLSL